MKWATGGRDTDVCKLEHRMLRLRPPRGCCRRSLVMLAVAFIAFALFNFVGDPVQQHAAARRRRRTTASRCAPSSGSTSPSSCSSALPRQRACQGNFGISLRLGRPVSTLIVERLPATLELALSRRCWRWSSASRSASTRRCGATRGICAGDARRFAGRRLAAHLPHRHPADPRLRGRGSGLAARPSAAATPCARRLDHRLLTATGSRRSSCRRSRSALFQ